MKTYTILGKPLSTTNSKMIRKRKDGSVFIMDSADAIAYKKSALIQFLAQRFPSVCIEGPCEVWMKIYRERNSGDVDNYAKGIIDSMQDAGIVRNDSLIVRLIMEKFTDPENPRVEVSIAERPTTGILFPL